MKASNVNPRDVTNAIADALSLLENGIELLHDNGSVDFGFSRTDENGIIEIVVETGEVFRLTIERLY